MDFGFLEKLIKGLAPTSWKGKHKSAAGNTTELTTQVVDCGLNLANQKTWVKARFTEGADTHTLMGKTKATEPGTQGGADEITLDDKPVEHDDVVLSLHFSLFPPAANLVLTYKFGNGERYEFEGRAPIEKIIGL